MSSPIETFTLPDVGEGLTEAEILCWRVEIGDQVEVNQVLLEIETAKAAVELPAPYAGTVVRKYGEVGQTLAVGSPLIDIEVEARPDQTPARTAVLVGYGVADTAGRTRRPRRATVMSSATGPTSPAEPSPTVPLTTHPLPTSQQGVSPILAKPPVRLLARVRGLSLDSITATGPGGTISRDDVERAATLRAAVSAVPAVPTVPTVPVIPAPTAPDSRETRIPVRGVMKAMAEAMTTSVNQAVHVTEWVSVDVTEAMGLMSRLRTHPDWAESRLSILTLAAKAVSHAVARNPLINATWRAETAEIELHRDVHLGIAAATPRGLLVPVIPHAHKRGLRELAAALGDLTARAKAGTLTPSDLVGGTITITNIGVFGIDGGTPILVPGQAAILCLGRVAKRPWVVGDDVSGHQVLPRDVLELTLSFDHRFIDGATGSAVLRDIADFLGDPAGYLIV